MSAALIISLVSIVVVLLTNFAIVVRDHYKVLELAEWKKDVEKHLVDTDRHIDPRRDSEWRADLIKRMDKMDKKLDNILSFERDNISKRKGDSDDA